jgi:hypothetical protein
MPRCDPPDAFRLKLLDRLSSASSTLLDAYALPDSSIALFHRDFAARNILVVHNPDEAGGQSQASWTGTSVKLHRSRSVVFGRVGFGHLTRRRG